MAHMAHMGHIMSVSDRNQSSAAELQHRSCTVEPDIDVLDLLSPRFSFFSVFIVPEI